MSIFWIIVATGLMLLSGPLQSMSLLLLGTLVMLLAAVSRLWARYCLARVEFRYYLSSYRVFAGDDVEFVVQITNRKFLPIPWIQVNHELPQELVPVQGRIIPSQNPARMVLATLLSMGWYHRITRRFTLSCQHRGYFFLGPVRIRSGDLFGMFTSEAYIERDQFLTIYPQILPLVSSRLPSRKPYGNTRVQRNLMDDITLPMGSREYVVGDSLRYIHWKATARTGHPQTRVFDASTTSNFIIFFGVRTLEHPFLGSRPDLLELGILTTTALANYALEHGYSVGVYVNQASRLTASLMQVHPARHPQQLTRILEVMAHVHADETIPMTELILDQCKNLSWGTTIVVVTAVPDDETLATMARLRRSGWTVSFVHVGGSNADDSVKGISRFTVSRTMEWQQLQEIVLQ